MITDEGQHTPFDLFWRELASRSKTIVYNTNIYRFISCVQWKFAKIRRKARPAVRSDGATGSAFAFGRATLPSRLYSTHQRIFGGRDGDIWPMYIRPPSENIKFIPAIFIGQFLVANWPRYTEIAVKMIWGQSRCHVLGVKGHRRSNLKNQDFQILIADLDSLRVESEHNQRLIGWWTHWEALNETLLGYSVIRIVTFVHTIGA